MIAKLEKCPEPVKLSDFLLGNLPPDESQVCEKHLERCEPCLDTIRGLNVHDTLHDLTRAALDEDAASSIGCESTEQPAVDELVRLMKGLSQPYSTGEIAKEESQSSPPEVRPEGHRDSSLADRAAEVQRLLEPAESNEDLGILGHYRLTELLGAGSTGVVYKAIDTQLQRDVALKILRPSLGDAARDRFVAEARATAAIDHPNVVTIYQVGTDGPLAFIAMQWLPGKTLEQVLELETILTPEKTKKLAAKIATGLGAAHACGLIHRDIKPANIWIADDDESVKILDFGLVRIADENPQLTCTGMIAGTPSFMSPEQSRGESLDGRSDLFSLGCIMYQALTGRLPFRSDNALATLQSIQREQPTNPDELNPEVSADLSDLTMSLLEKSASFRPSSAEVVVHALETERKHWRFAVSPKRPAKQISTQRESNRFLRSVGYMLVGIAIGLLGFAGCMFAPQIIRIATNQGEIVIETMVDDVQIEILQDGKSVRVIDLASNQSIDIRAGKYEIRPLGDMNSISLSKNVLTLSRGETEIVRVTQDLRDKKNIEPIQSANQVDGTKPATGTHILDAGDTLGIFVEGVTGDDGFNPPVRFPPPSSGLPPSLGYPMQVASDGTINLPLIDPVPVKSLTVAQAEKLIYRTYTGGDDPILNKHARIIVSLMQSRDYRPPNSNQVDRTKPTTGTYILDAGDTLGIFIEGVTGDDGFNPPVRFPPPSSGLPPSLGFPMQVASDGTINLPLIDPVPVKSLTLSQAEKLIYRTYTRGDNPILNENARIMVSLMQSKDYRPPNSTTKKAKDSNMSALFGGGYALVEKAGASYKLKRGDVLGIYIEHVLGAAGSEPPVNWEQIKEGSRPATGFPIAIDEDGTISLPLIEPIRIEGDTVMAARKKIFAAYTEGDRPLLIAEEAKVLVSLMWIRPDARNNRSKFQSETDDRPHKSNENY